MYFCVSNTEYGFIGVHCGFTPAPGIILNTHTLIHGYHESHSSRIMFNTVTYTLILKLYPTPPSGEG